MTDLSTNYMGLQLKNPIIAGASNMTVNMDSIKRLEDAGVAALVTKSLFEEQIQLERFKFDEDLEKGNYRSAEMITLRPHLEYAGYAEHLMWVGKTKETVAIPVIASLNAVNRETWVEYAGQLEQTGADALECNLFASPGDTGRDGATVESEQIEIVKEIKRTVSIPVSLKLSFFYTNSLNVIRRLAEAGADGFVLFNRLFEPDIDIQDLNHVYPLNFSSETDYRLSLRYAGLLAGTLDAYICCGTGIFSGETVAKMVLAGADVVQIVSALFRHGCGHVGTMIRDLEAWMDGNGYASPADFRGKLSYPTDGNPWAYTRGQYVRLLMNPSEIVKNWPAV